MDTINERLMILINALSKGNISKFANSIGVRPTTIEAYVGKKQSKPGADILEKICEAYTNVNPAWLLTGKGEMLKSGSGDAMTASEGSINNKQGMGNRFEARTGVDLSSEAERLRLENEYLKKDNKRLESQLQDKDMIIEMLKNKKG